MKHFITGGSGFVGQHLVDECLQHGDEVVVFDREPLSEKHTKNPKVHFVEGDVRDVSALTEAMQGCDVVHHNAALLPIAKAGKAYWEVNVGGTKAVLEAARATGIRKVLNVSSSAVYGVPLELPVTEETSVSPVEDYGKSKVEAENICKKFREEHDLDISIVRPRTIIGIGRVGIMGMLFDWIMASKRIYIIGNGKNLYQFIGVDDFVHACYLMTIKPCKNEDFNIGTHTYGTVREDLEALVKHAGTTARVQPTSATLLRMILKPLNVLRISPLGPYHYTVADKPIYFDITKAETMLGWKAQAGNIEALVESYDWYKENRDAINAQVGTTHSKSVKQGILAILRKFS